MIVSPEEVYLKGIPICRGVAIGTPFFLSLAEDIIPEFTVTAEDVEEEISRYRRAVARSIEDIKNLQQQLEQEQLLESAAILDSQLQMLQDPSITTSVESEISHTLKNAESVFQGLISQYQKKFNDLEDSFFKERFKDIQDISRRVMSYLRATVRFSLTKLPSNSILFSRELTASDTAEANIACVAAFVTALGGATSHAAIVAKAKGASYVSNINLDEIDTEQHSLAIVDGRTGDVILSPTKETLNKYENIRDQLQCHLKKLESVCNLKAETYDGYNVRISANIAMASELAALHQHGGHGVGLFRSEYIFLAKDKFPSEAEQFEIYKELVEKMRDLPIVIRTFDVGGDKSLPPSQPPIYESNPFLGCRAIRFLLKERDIFKAQICAILRASVFGDVSIMFPMVSTLTELLEAKSLVKEAQDELERRGEQKGSVRIGCMIEVPSAAIIADLLAKECDFLSIGTNDLVQYALAVDRSNHAMSSLYTPTHPSVIRLIKLIVNEANHHGIPVTICGEVAADPRFTPLLLGLGVHELSIATRFIPTVKHAVRNTSIVACSRLAETVLNLTTASEVQELLTQEYKKNTPEDFFYNY
jgi:phosphotransferase system enzyme I (PtsI)